MQPVVLVALRLRGRRRRQLFLDRFLRPLGASMYTVIKWLQHFGFNIHAWIPIWTFVAYEKT